MDTRTSYLIVVTALIGAVAVGGYPVSAEGLSAEARYAVGTALFAAVLWITGAVPLPVTALSIPILLTVFGVYPDVADSFSGFSHPVIFLILAGFMLAEALQRHGIDRWIAYYVLAKTGSSPRRLVLGVMVTTAGLSMVISNTATTAVMVPIGVGLVEEVVGEEGLGKRGGEGEYSNLQVATLLGTAYAASVGGVGSLIGTPPNAIAVAYLDSLLDVEISFVDWLAIGLPMVVVTLPIVWFLLTYVLYPPEIEDVSGARQKARGYIAEEESLGTPEARRTAYVFGATAVLWLLGGFGFVFESVVPTTWHTTVFGGDGLTVFGTHGAEGALYYVIVGLASVPALVVSGAVDWEDIEDIDWGTLVLFGGGVSLASSLSDTGATKWIADSVFSPLEGASLVVVVLVVAVFTVGVGELASNTAMAAVLAPLLITFGGVYGDVETSVLLAVAGAVTSSYGFALPVATPPNAIVFGTDYIDRRHMLRAGGVLDVVMVVVATALLLVVSRRILGVLV
ncbi:SLC13 family permease [Halorutilales archaeon Cl-col2-1]